METKELKEIMSWIKTTDLVEVCFKENGRGFSFAAFGGGQAAPRPAASSEGSYFSGNRQAVVAAPGIGIFQWGEPGKSRPLSEGKAVKAGDSLGFVEAGLGQKLAIAVPCSGKLQRVMVEAGQGVEFGQPIFVIEPDV